MLLEQPEVAAEVMAGEAALEVSILHAVPERGRNPGGLRARGRGGAGRGGVTGEVLVADNGSSDGSPALAAAAGARVVEVAARGYGNALAGGIAAARGPLRADGRRRRLLRLRRAAPVPRARCAPAPIW